MTSPVPGPTTPEWAALFEAVHVGLAERDAERAVHAETQALARNLRADLDDTKVRLADAQVASHRLERELADTLRLVDGLRDERKELIEDCRTHEARIEELLDKPAARDRIEAKA